MKNSMPTLPPRHKKTRLPARLAAIAERLPEEGVFCDVGSDHGLLPLFLLQQRKALRAVVTDIKPLPLARAKEALAAGGVADRAECVLADGIASLGGRGIDFYAIAGMSGETIAQILREGKTTLHAGQRFYLQPMSHEDILRTHLSVEGFRITEETVIRENGRLFLLICATFTGMPGEAPDPITAALGMYLDQHPGVWGRAYFEIKRDRLVRTAEKRRAAGLDAFDQESVLARIREILKEEP